MEEQTYSQGVVDALVESNEILQEEVSRLRNNNRMLRTVISAQRKTATVLRDQVAIAAANDEAFKAMCQETIVQENFVYKPESFDVMVEPTDEGGLPGVLSPVEP